MNDARPDRQSAGADFSFSRPGRKRVSELQASSILDGHVSRMELKLRNSLVHLAPDWPARIFHLVQLLVRMKMEPRR